MWSVSSRNLRALVVILASIFTQPAVAQYSTKPPWVNPWSYSYAFSTYTGAPFDDEASAVAHGTARPELNQCAPPVITPNGAWFNTGGIDYNLRTQERRNYDVLIVNSPPQCSGTNNPGGQVTRSRSVGCPSSHPFWNDSIKLCEVFSPVLDPERNQESGTCSAVGNPIHGHSGVKMQAETDFVSPTSALLRFDRYYRSKNVVRTFLGEQWRHTFSRHLMVYTNYSTGALIGVWAFRHDSSRDGFRWNGSALTGDPGVRSTLAKILAGDGTLLGWDLRTEDDTIETYSPDGQLLSIEARGGDKLTLTYSGERLIEVADRQGRKLTFGYTVLATNNALRLTSMTLPDGREVRYEYNAGNYLWKVARPDATPSDWTDNPRRTYVYGEGTYGTASRLTGIVDESGSRYASWRYDSSGRATLSVHGDDTSYVDRVEVAYTDTNRSTIKEYTSATTFSSRTVDYILTNNLSRVSAMSQSCTSCRRSEKAMTYDANGNCDLVTDFANTVTDYDYDSRSLLTKRIDAKSQGANSNLPEKRTTETDWHTTFRLPIERRIKNAAGTIETKSTYSYNTRGQLLTQTQIDPATSAARTTTYTYCEQADVEAPGSTCPLLGLRKSIDGPRTDVSDVTTFAYYATTDESGCATAGGPCRRMGDLWKVTNALGQVTEYMAYDKTGRVTRMKDVNGVVTDLEYTERGWLSRKLVRGTNDASESDDAITQFLYDAAGQVTRVTQPDGAYLNYTYDNAHRLTGIADNVGNTITYALDGLGNRLQEDTKDPSATLKRTLSRVYNTLGQMTALKNAAGTTIATNTYDASSNIDTVLDAESRLTNNDYDPLNRLKQTIQDVGGVAATVSYTYDARDNLRQVTDPKTLNTVYTYDGLNNLTQLSSPDTGVTSYTYDAAGNRASQTDARNVTTSYTYDALNRLTGITYPTTNLNVTFAYDTVGSHCTTGNTFSIGRLKSITDHSGSTTYCYDRRGNVTSKRQVTTAPTGSGARTFTTSYTYTMADRLASLTYPNATTATYSRNTLGQITAVQYGAQNIVTAASYLPFGPLGSLTYASGQALTRSYDANYWPTGVQSSVLAQHYALDQLGNIEAFGVTSGVPVVAESYVYDGLDRLKEVRDANNALIEAYAYDATGNRTSKTRSGSTQAYGYPSNNHRLTSIGATARGYDANGNWTTTGGSTVHTFDDRNRLAGRAGSVFDYNGLGQRVGVNERVFGYDETGRLAFESGDANVATPAVDRQFVWLDDAPVGYVDAGTVYYVHADHLNTPRVVTTTAGTAVWKWGFQGNPFGENGADEDPDVDLVLLTYPLRFPGQYDDGAGVFYNYFRDYEPDAGRYVESDPIGLAGGPSTYGYALLSPLLYQDPTGQNAAARIIAVCFRWPKLCIPSLPRPARPLPQPDPRGCGQGWDVPCPPEVPALPRPTTGGATGMCTVDPDDALDTCLQDCQDEVNICYDLVTQGVLDISVCWDDYDRCVKKCYGISTP